MKELKVKMMERKAYTAFGEMGFGKTGRHPCETYVELSASEWSEYDLILVAGIQLLVR